MWRMKRMRKRMRRIEGDHDLSLPFHGTSFDLKNSKFLI